MGIVEELTQGVNICYRLPNESTRLCRGLYGEFKLVRYISSGPSGLVTGIVDMPLPRGDICDYVPNTPLKENPSTPQHKPWRG